MRSMLIALMMMFITSAPSAAPKEPIIIGEMMSYTSAPRYAYPYRDAWQMAVDEVNAQGGIKGRAVKVISRDDQGKPAVAVRVANELIDKHQAVLLMGAGFDHVGLAVSAVANQRKVPFVKIWGGKCDNVEAPKNRYWFIAMECMDYHGYMLAVEAAKKPYKRWATIAPNYEYGRNVVASFKTALQKLRPDVEFVAERYPILDKIRAQEELRAIERSKPEAIFNQLFGSDIAQYLRMLQRLGIEDKYFHIGNYIGTPLTMRELSDAYPSGWFTTGLPSDLSDYPAAKEFAASYAQKYNTQPDMVAFESYRMMQFVLTALNQAEDLSSESITKALLGLAVETPTGRHVMDADSKQLLSGYWVGYTARENNENQFINHEWFDLKNVQEDYQR